MHDFNAQKCYSPGSLKIRFTVAVIFYWKLVCILGGAFLEFLFVGLVFWIAAKGSPSRAWLLWTARLSLVLGAGLVLVHAVLARDLVLFVGQGLAGVMLYRWLQAHSS